VTISKEKRDAVEDGPFVRFFGSIAEVHISNGYSESMANDIAGYAVTAATMALDVIAKESNNGELITSISACTIACQLLRDYLIGHCQDMQENSPRRLAEAARATAEYAREVGEEDYAKAYDEVAKAADGGNVVAVPATIHADPDADAKTVH
jgi:hypothetical protein